MLPEEKRLATKEQLNEWLAYELPKYQAEGRFFRQLFPVAERDILKKHLVLLRKAEYHTNTNHRIRSLFYRVRLYRLQNKYCLHIPINTCAKGLKIMHVGPILINDNAIVGEDCSIHMNVGLVAGGRNDYAPELGKGVVMGIGSIALGKIKIADNVAVGANAVITRSIEEIDIAVAGVPAKKISDNGRSKWKARNGKR